MDRNDHFLCESCGSTDVRRTKLTRLDRLLRSLSGGKRFTCGSCGWTGLRNWSHVPAALVARRLALSKVEGPKCKKLVAMKIDHAPQLLGAASH